MNIKALIAALVTVFVGAPLTLALFLVIIHFAFPLLIIGLGGLFVFIFYIVYCDYFSIKS